MNVIFESDAVRESILPVTCETESRILEFKAPDGLDRIRETTNRLIRADSPSVICTRLICVAIGDGDMRAMTGKWKQTSLR